jgi:hypothetical protein
MTKSITINTHRKIISGTNQLGVEAGTNGPQGGDSGHGCRTFIKISEEGGTDWRVVVVDENGEEILVDSPSSIAITLSGDSELSTMIRTLEFALTALRGTSEGGKQQSTTIDF